MVRHKPSKRSVKEERACTITDSSMKQGSAASVHWKQVLCPQLHFKTSCPSSGDMCNERPSRSGKVGLFEKNQLKKLPL